MKLSTWASTLFLAQTALGVNVDWRKKLKNVKRQSSSGESYPDVPTYNFTMPVDHFDQGNDATYDNRFFVNDTYYKAGGPVILFDFGEGGVSPSSAADFLAEYSMVSAPVRLAEELGGLVIGWEHRYYGYSRPVPMDDSTGLPRSGAAGYEFLTADQAIEDVAYFANNFNKTELSLNDVIDSTEKLDPYHTPWIMVGGSYPGMRAAWARLMHPEIFYAAWSSSAPLETMADGSIYYNPIARSLPQNCTNDIEAAIKYVDESLTNGPESDAITVYAGTYLSTDETATYDDIDTAYTYTPFDVGSGLTYALAFGSYYQSFGPIHTAQYFCDYMESFDVDTYLSDSSDATTDVELFQVLFGNSGDATPSSKGIAASNDDSGALAFAAMVYGIVNGRAAFYDWTQSLPDGGSESFTEAVDGLSWSWQTINEMGYYQGSNASNPIQVISKYYNVTAFRELQVEDGYFPTFRDSSFPDKLNNSYLLDLGGWDMTASNVMFTNGEFDPWRSFSVHSEETESGAPTRSQTTSIPKCNQLPNGTDVFGLVYPGAVHAEDLSNQPYVRGSTEDPTPLDQGMALFLKAWDAWSPCFNQSRDDIRNNKGVDGNGNDADGSSIDEEDNSNGGGNDDDDNSAGRAGSLSVISVVVGVMSAILALM
ncbi:serine carboxypeptidase S28-domain-containing protein [Dactylonectria estremocensis]|uniref:Serine carboxypeptidase S28-domain-containing protein n=1 Tax=Dactylonectria estremocensis TaxID=1079267 RepID=A0A9P9EPN6_9HYPO|nr:serine carboxypeptidase S28-domain-containing protein [Dactylonectria estremocensis]